MQTWAHHADLPSPQIRQAQLPSGHHRLGSTIAQMQPTMNPSMDMSPCEELLLEYFSLFENSDIETLLENNQQQMVVVVLAPPVPPQSPSHLISISLSTLQPKPGSPAATVVPGHASLEDRAKGVSARKEVSNLISSRLQVQLSYVIRHSPALQSHHSGFNLILSVTWSVQHRWRSSTRGWGRFTSTTSSRIGARDKEKSIIEGPRRCRPLAVPASEEGEAGVAGIVCGVDRRSERSRGRMWRPRARLRLIKHHCALLEQLSWKYGTNASKTTLCSHPKKNMNFIFQCG
ncbi:uncharacterized protein LOC123405555 [Hordeum vulgare subsp. vulgare]|uniref:uncharacterized protein LOC123405555 n=1 Tax=Hordeum vulgare subsp. vulgare TaxID=112509 RepID=UPI001D1A370A|nr:uncharacterized protein LOC123405555 [Hordeum vulgare subsp. vulgare]